MEFEGNTYRPQDLEQGDRIVAEVEGDSRYLSVRSIIVTENSSYGGGYQSDDQHISGTLQKIDTRNKRLIIDTNERGREVQVRFNKRTQVLFGDRNIAISELREYDTLTTALRSSTSGILLSNIGANTLVLQTSNATVTTCGQRRCWSFTTYANDWGRRDALELLRRKSAQKRL